jgi:hypothetical protein
MRRSLKFYVPLLALAALGASCAVFSERGSGIVVTESREVNDFNEIVLEGSGGVIVEVTGDESLSIEAEDNIIPLLETEVRNGRLRLGSGSSISPTTEIIYTITAATLDGVVISGSGNVSVTGLESADFRVEISGSGNVETAGTVADTLSVSISGSGEYDGEDLVAADGNVNVDGSGNAVVNVTGSLDISLSGSGNIEYIGSPSVNVDKSGSGSVTQRE